MHPTRNYFAEYKGTSKVFIETGSYRGDGIQLAIDAGYELIVSIDNDPANIEFCTNRFPEEVESAKVILVLSESHEGLSFIKHGSLNPVIWLDAHWQMLEGTDPGQNPFPLLKELDAIKKSNRKDATIIIDDMLIMQRDIVGYTKKEIEKAIYKINPDYKIEYMPNPVINGILIAHL